MSTFFEGRASRLLPILASCIVAATVGCVGDGPRPASRAPSFFFTAHVEDARVAFDDEQFRSFRKGGTLSEPFALGDDTRLALTPPLPSKLTFDVDVPRNPIFRFSIGASTMGRPVQAFAVRFRVLVDDEEIFSDVVPRSRPNEWLDREADLSPWAGSRVQLTFETLGPRDARPSLVLPLWGDPVLADRAPATASKLILISIDCLRADHVGAYGYPHETTPNLDRLAEEGVVFDAATATSSYTHPTHMSMLTGLPPSIHGATRRRRLSDDVPNLPELLQQAGYRTDAVVSAAFLSRSFGFERGFHTHLYDQDPGAARIVDHGLDVLRRGEGQDQFLFLHLFDTHLPYAPPAEFRERFGPRTFDLTNLYAKVLRDEPPSSEEEIQQVIYLYDGELAYLDQELGRFFDELKAMALYDASLIIVTADHGEAFYEHGYWEHTQTLYDEMVHIPLIVKWPNSSPTGRVETVVSQTDVFPTLLEQAGAPSPSEWATSLSRHFAADAEASSPRTVVTEVTWDPLPDRRALMKVAFRRQSSKYIATLNALTLEELHEGQIVREELYDLSVDPDEKDNVIESADRRTRRAYRRELRDYLAHGRRLQLERQGEEVVLDEAIRDRLDALGYIER